MIAFIGDHRGSYGVEPICKVLPIAPSTYHDHIAKRADLAKLSTRARRDMALKPEIARVFAENFEVYGVRKVWRQMLREGFGVARCTVQRLMADLDLQGVIRGKPVRTTVQDKAAPCPLDHVNRQFHAPAPNVLWVSGDQRSSRGHFTYVSTWAGFVYVAFVIDVYARRIVGWTPRIIPSALWNDLLRPLDIREGADASCLGDEAVPGGAAGVHDGLLAGEQPPRQIAIP
jgi:transposase InsO family protein